MTELHAALQRGRMCQNIKAYRSWFTTHPCLRPFSMSRNAGAELGAELDGCTAFRRLFRHGINPF